jgi:hypothetical protein
MTASQNALDIAPSVVRQAPMFIFIEAGDACLLQRPSDVNQGSLARLPEPLLEIG